MNTELIASSWFQPDLGLLAVSLNPVGRRLDKRLVHKSYDENVLVSHIEAVQPPGTIAHSGRDAAPDRMDHFRATLCINRDHPLFFDRDCGHVHAICLMEAAQQTTIAIVATQFFQMPADVVGDRRGQKTPRIVRYQATVPLRCRPWAALTCNTNEARLYFALKGLGIAYMSEFSVRDALEAGIPDSSLLAILATLSQSKPATVCPRRVLVAIRRWMLDGA